MLTTEFIMVNSAPTPASDDVITALAHAGWLVSAATSPTALRERIEQHGPPALLICTSTMIRASEAALCKELQRDGKTRILIVLTADAQAPRTAIHRLEADDSLFWPFGVDELVNRVRQLMHNREKRKTPEEVPSSITLTARTAVRIPDGDPEALLQVERKMPYKIGMGAKSIRPYKLEAYHFAPLTFECGGHVVCLRRNLLPS